MRNTYARSVRGGWPTRPAGPRPIGGPVTGLAADPAGRGIRLASGIMRAIQVDRYGGPEVLEVAGVADPVAGPRQVVVEVAAADVLFLDCQIRGGWGEMFGVVPPYVPGNGVAGVVVSLGDGSTPSGWAGRWWP